MIIIMIGGIGSGKTLSIVKEIIDGGKMAYTNFKLKNFKNYHRLKVSDIVMKEDKKLKVNWDFWENVRKNEKRYSIFLDEVHNIASSRRSMSGFNVQISRWLSQIRKILSDSPTNHLYLITQRLESIDIQFRELSQILVACKSYPIKDCVYIKQKYYDGIYSYERGLRGFMKVFLGNRYFKYYDTNEMVTFSDAEEFI